MNFQLRDSCSDPLRVFPVVGNRRMDYREWHKGRKIARTSRAFICNSNTAARRDVLVNTRSSDLVDIRRGFRAGKGGYRYLVLVEVQTDKVSGTGGGGERGLAADMAGEEERKRRGCEGEKELRRSREEE